MRVHHILLAAAAAALAACGEQTTADTDQDSSDIASLPSNDMGNTYPSQTGQSTTITPGAEGGPGSAATGASDPGAAGTNDAGTTATPPQ